MTQVVLASIQVGLPRHFGEEEAHDPMDRSWTTGFYKEPIFGSIWMGSMNLEGDGQADRIHHGGPDKAVLVYSAHHYDAWREELNLPTMTHGGFGENFTLEGLTEAEVCIGDTWRIGKEATVQVSQPRQPCWKLARRWRKKSLALLTQQTGRTGWYFRAMIEGSVVAGMPITLLERLHPEWSIDRANQVMHSDKDDLRLAEELAGIPLLSSSWQSTLKRRVERRKDSDPLTRLMGENGP